MTTPPRRTRRRALPLCLGLLLATASLAACDRRASSTNTPRDSGSTAPTPPPDRPSSDPATPSTPASGLRP